MMTKRCPTCTRYRPGDEFRIGEGEVQVTAAICRPCRTVLWDDPDSPTEGM
jgi:MOSC domain-containing protein YiiM